MTLSSIPDPEWLHFERDWLLLNKDDFAYEEVCYDPRKGKNSTLYVWAFVLIFVLVCVCAHGRKKKQLN